MTVSPARSLHRGQRLHDVDRPQPWLPRNFEKQFQRAVARILQIDDRFESSRTDPKRPAVTDPFAARQTAGRAIDDINAPFAAVVVDIQLRLIEDLIECFPERQLVAGERYFDGGRFATESVAMIDDPVARLLGELGQHVGQRGVFDVDCDPRSLGLILHLLLEQHLADAIQTIDHLGRHARIIGGQQRQGRRPQIDDRLFGLVANGQLGGVEPTNIPPHLPRPNRRRLETRWQTNWPEIRARPRRSSA